MRSERATYAACLTPPGRAAIATLAIRGPRAWEVVRRLFRPLSPAGSPLPVQPAVGRIWVGRLGDALADTVVLTVIRAAPMPWVEVHCHGGPEVVHMLLEGLESGGVETCSWQDLELETTEDRTQAVVTAQLARAPTARTAAFLLDQYHGAFDEALAAARAALDAIHRDEAGRRLADLARQAPLGRHLTTPWQVVVAGAPNVGKSSLVNALAGFQRTVVSATAGTTRDVVTTLIAVDGWPVQLADTAGVRAGGTGLEGQGIELARSAVAAADLCLWVLDASVPPVWPDFSAPRLRYLVNKTDLPAAWDLGQAAEAVQVSAKTGAGLPELCERLASWLVPQPPPSGAGVPFTAALCDRIDEAYRAFEAGRWEEASRALEMAQSELRGR